MNDIQFKHFQEGFGSFGLKYPDLINTNYPGIKLYQHYQHWLTKSIRDFGCGDGATIKYLKNRGHIDIIGYDMIDLDNGNIVCDITKDAFNFSKTETGICMDVLEHLRDNEIELFMSKNFCQCGNKILSVSKNQSFDAAGNDLHINKKEFSSWIKFLSGFFEIKEALRISKDQLLLLGA